MFEPSIRGVSESREELKDVRYAVILFRGKRIGHGKKRQGGKGITARQIHYSRVRTVKFLYLEL